MHTLTYSLALSLSLSFKHAHEQDSVDLAPAVNQIVTISIKVQEVAFMFVDCAFVTKLSPVQILRQNLGRGNE